jgi:putative ABC transport system permease protein
MKMIATSEATELNDFGIYREIVEGRMFNGLNEAVISQELARHNNVSIGDVIEFRGAYATDISYNLTVVGIYSDTTEEYANFFMAMHGRFADNRRNEILTSFETLLAAGWQDNAGLDMRSAYFLRNPDDLGKFEAQVRAMGLPFTYNVNINQAAYDRVTGPLAGMRSAAMTFMFVMLILGAITLALVSYMAVRERKYEVGVLRAMGMERGMVALGMIAESVMIAAICLVLGLGIGSAVAQPIADGILEGQVTQAEAEANAGSGNNRVLFAGGQLHTSDTAAGYSPVSEIQLNLGAEVIIQIILITLALAALTGIIGVVIITQYEPLKILRERN